jgi:hypothetical protein
MKPALLAVTLVLGALGTADAQAPARILESFDDAAAFQALPSDGVRLTLRGDSGVVGRALRMEFDYRGHAGYAAARRAFTLPPLPAYWAITLSVRGVARPNTLELKLVDSSGQNVWWMRRPDLHVANGWTRLRFRPSDLGFARGPLGGGPPRGIASLEIAFAAGRGGEGWLVLDELAVTPLPPPVPDRVRPSVSASSTLMGRPAALAIPPSFAAAPTDTASAGESAGWRSAGDGAQWLALDFGGPRPLSGLVLDWSTRDWAADYDVEASDDGREWTVLRSVRNGSGGRRYLHLPGVEATKLRLSLKRSSRGNRYALRAVRLLSDSVASTRTDFLELVAQGSGPGAWRTTPDMIAYEREPDSTLVIGAGIPIAWARDAAGVDVRGLQTVWGSLTLRVVPVAAAVRVTIEGVRPAGGIELRAPFGAVPVTAWVNGVQTPLVDGGRAVRLSGPATVELRY